MDRRTRAKGAERAERISTPSAQGGIEVVRESGKKRLRALRELGV
jgi:tRNA U34 5-carboxymethylaminomethyl modifying GTPase MnmE/TrmE